MSKMFHKPPGLFLYDGFYYRMRFLMSLWLCITEPGNMQDQADMSLGSVLVQANYYSYLISYFTNYSPISDNVGISCSDERTR